MLRRPPTVISLRPSDVTDMAELVATRNAAAEDQKEVVTETGDAVLDKEQAERIEREKRPKGERIGV